MFWGFCAHYGLSAHAARAPCGRSSALGRLPGPAPVGTRPRGLLGPVVLAGLPGSARPGPAAAWLVPAAGNRDRRAQRAGGGECGRGAGAGLLAARFGPGAAGTEGAAPGMPQAGISCPFVAPRRPGMPGWSLPDAAGPGPLGCGSRIPPRRPSSRGGRRLPALRSRSGTCPRARQSAGCGAGVHSNLSCTFCLQGKRRDVLTAFRSRRCPLSLQPCKAAWRGTGRGCQGESTLHPEQPTRDRGLASPAAAGLQRAPVVFHFCSLLMLS